ncbi:MAG: hypothetical protein H0U90_07840 [Actinobacteria bacterium]|nr:hypothetical protein [Actinomycetota bacterium]
MLDLLARVVEVARITAPDELKTYVATLVKRARDGRSLSAAEAVVVDSAGGWLERAA